MSDEYAAPVEEVVEPSPVATPLDQSPTAQTAIEKRPGGATIMVGPRGLAPKNLDELYRLAQYVKATGLAPKGLLTSEQIILAMQVGMEAGLKPLTSLRAIVVINGMPGWKVNAALAKVRSTGLLALFRPRWVNLPKAGTPLKDWPADAAHQVTIQRKGEEPLEFEFSVGDARQGRLWEKKGRNDTSTPWITFPKRMLLARNVGFALNDVFSDVLLSIRLVEEVQDLNDDYPNTVDLARDATAAVDRVGPVIDTPPKSDPFLDAVAPVQKVRTSPAPTPPKEKPREKPSPAADRGERLAQAKRVLQDEIASRTKDDPAARPHLERDLFRGKKLAELGEDEVRAAAASLLAHPVFGSPEGA